MKRGPHSTPEAHPGTDVLLDWVEGKLSVQEHRDVAEHVRTCGSCHAEVGAFEKLLQAIKDEAADPPPQDLHAWAAGLSEPVNRVFPRRAALLRLVTDSWATIRDAAAAFGAGPEPLPALRSLTGMAPRLGRRRVLFSCGEFDLDIEIDYSGQVDPRRLHGQVLPAGGTRRLWLGSEIRLVVGDEVAARVKADRRGEFVIPRARPGKYRIEVQGPVSCATPSIEI